MSSFICSDKLFNRILTFFDNWDFYNDSKVKFAFWKLVGKPNEREKELSRIGLKLKSLNVEAVNQRYSEDNGKQNFIYKKEDCNIYQAYNHIRCLTYQMSEGNVPKTKIYKLLEKIENLIALQIANENPKVKNAEWDAE